jgi:hypothetical protein
MKFEEFWSALEELLQTKRDFVTIRDEKSFKITPSIDAIRVDSERFSIPRVIKKEEFVKVYRASLDFSDEKKFHPGNYAKISQNASYIVTLFDHIMNQR